MKTATIQNMALIFTKFMLIALLAIFLVSLVVCLRSYPVLSEVIFQKWLFNFLTFQMAIWHSKFEGEHVSWSTEQWLATSNWDSR